MAKTLKQGNDAREHLRQQAWDYFAVHASQRLTTFNFYLLVATLLTTGILASFQKQYQFQFAGIILGLLLVIFSFVFWKLDQRNRYLIKHAEGALREFENLHDSSLIPNGAKLFSIENEGKLIRYKDTRLFWKWNLTYTNCFNLAFVIFAIFGLAGIILSLYLLIISQNDKLNTIDANFAKVIHHLLE